jgi:hypothetical protein
MWNTHNWLIDVLLLFWHNIHVWKTLSAIESKHRNRLSTWKWLASCCINDPP